METTTHHRGPEIVAKKWRLFRPQRGLATSDLFLDTMLDWGTGETHLIDYTESFGNIYGSESRTHCRKSKTYRDAQLGEHVHSIMVKHAPEHEVICRSKPIREKHREGETPIEWQPPRASGCVAITPSWG
jgi:hypothetical protein